MSLPDFQYEYQEAVVNDADRLEVMNAHGALGWRCINPTEEAFLAHTEWHVRLLFERAQA